MPPRIRLIAAASASGRKSQRKISSLTIKLAFLASCSIHQIIQAEPSQHSTIPRSNNRYSHYNTDSTTDSSSSSGSSSSSALGSTGLDTLSSPAQSHASYHPPWNPSPKIDPSGFLSENYTRLPGEWEPLANIRGKHGPRNVHRYEQLLEKPMQIRQVPGDGNCLFHSIAACLHYELNDGRCHLPMDSYDCIGKLRVKSLELRNNAVDVLQNVERNGRRKLFLQGEEYLEAHELLGAAAAQFDLEGEEYCELMRKESYWGGGPEIVALCNYLQRPIHIYELMPADEASNNQANDNNSNNQGCNNMKKTSTQFTLRRMACFGSPKFDRREPLHILSADSRFPDIEPRRIRKVGNHFLALFPATNTLNDVRGEGGEKNRFKRHALIRGGSRIMDGSIGKDATTTSTSSTSPRRRRRVQRKSSSRSRNASSSLSTTATTEAAA
mmetsp:Transcript_3877/g.8669  ORF Transcript_3877/g.8669 Transcript_3877/m.8669 type:complete len:440 (+) Transcript_3877:111-1430(+)